MSLANGVRVGPTNQALLGASGMWEMYCAKDTQGEISSSLVA
jgi:hypothetical protein